MLTRWLLGGCSQSNLTSETGNYRFFVLHTVIWEAWCLNYGSLGSYFAILGAPWATLGAAGRTCGIQGRISVDFSMIWDPTLRAVRAPMVRNLVLFLGSVPCRSRHRFLDQNPGTWGSQNEVFAWKVLQKPTFRRNWKSQDLRISFA